MTLRNRLPVEPLSRSAWQRVREETFAELERGTEPAVGRSPRSRSATALFALAGAVVAAALMLLFFRSEAEKVDLSSTSRIEATHHLTRASLGDVALEASPGSALVTTGSDTIGWTVLLERGRVSFAVPKRERRATFKVQAAGTLVEVVGTRFTVARDGERVTVAVSEGTVRVTSDGRALAVHAAQTWENGGAPRLAEGNAESKVPASLGLHESPATRAPGSSERPATAPKSATAPRPENSSAAPEPVAPEPVVPVPAAPAAAEPVPIASSSAASPRSSERDRFETASRLEPTQPSAALAIYSELSRGRGPWAANALYAAGRLELERGQERRAKRLLELYVQRFPSGQNLEEARRLLETLH
jgi:hypothetical protein